MPEHFHYGMIMLRIFTSKIIEQTQKEYTCHVYIYDGIFNDISPKKIKIAEFNLKNIEILIENNLLENKLIKPLYLS